ncbi:dipeptidase [Sandaracinobacteroides saxicola]|uniref:Membrane dipeptidase n=1 Tax=Sandaracinobacteroides saxicola TaxID=2759707 RepID=A0A7G5IH84_9SPHN|nr:dipeptidase [Sandaracinobacteroides saxicola]QMW22726.1 membrane dipeptidase [Sandaracinobacteroides saxicola]
MKPLLLALLLAAASPALPAPSGEGPGVGESPQTATRIARLLRTTPLIDGHNDWPWALRKAHGDARYTQDLTADSRALPQPRHTDIPRLRAGGVGAQFWSVWIPADITGPAAVKLTAEQIDLVHAMVRRYPKDLELARTADDIVRIHRAGRVASLIGIEGGHQIDNSLGVLRQFFDAGARYMTLTHTATIDWADSSNDTPRHNGLAPFGKSVVAEMNRLGMLIDISHVSPKVMADVLDISKTPVIFSHSSVRALCDHPRNVPDDILARLPANGGVIMITFVPQFLSQARMDWGAAREAEAARAKSRFLGQPDRIKAATDAWDAANPRPVTTLAEVANHIEHAAKVAGHDHVGLGGDYDGIDITPVGLEGVDRYPALLAELARRGWSDANLRKLAGENLLRVMRANEAHARGQKDAPLTTATLVPTAK